MGKVNNNKGQAVLFVVVAATVGLAVVSAVAARTVTSIVRVTENDISSKSQSIAEAGVEKFLKYSITDLTNKAVDCPVANLQKSGNLKDNVINQSCILNIATQGVTQTAYVGLEALGNSTDYSLKVKPGETAGLQLGAGTSNFSSNAKITISIESADGRTPVSYAYTIYYVFNQGGGYYYANKGLVCYKDCSVFSEYKFDSSTTYNNTSTIDIANLPKLNSLNGSPTPIYISGMVFGDSTANTTYTLKFKSDGANFPIQGYRISAVGEVGGVSDSRSSRKQVSAVKFIPSNFFGFDYALSSGQDISSQ